MTEQKLIELIQVALPGAQVSVSLNGGHVDITVISADFAGTVSYTHLTLPTTPYV